jgi:hypothetical protein
MICPVLFYRIGKFIVSETTAKGLITTLIILVTSYIVPLAFATIGSINETGEIVNVYRSLGAEGLEEDMLGATYYGLHASFGLAMISIIFLSTPKMFLHKIVALCCVSAALLTTIHLVNRTGIIIFVICLFLSILYATRGRVAMRVKLLAICSVIIILVLRSIDGTIAVDILDAYMSREEAAEFDVASGGGRIKLSLNIIQKMLANPLGLPQEEYAHNLWLDIFRVAGFLPVIPFLVATYMNYKNLFYSLKCCDKNVMLCLLGLNLCTFMSCMVEPIIEGSALYFYLVMMLWGINSGVIAKQYLSQNLV